MLRRDPLYNNIIPDTHYTQVDIVLRSKNSKTRLLREEKRRHFYYYLNISTNSEFAYILILLCKTLWNGSSGLKYIVIYKGYWFFVYMCYLSFKKFLSTIIYFKRSLNNLQIRWRYSKLNSSN
ncbi:hypothetical protein QTP88_012473 [Uroleucon formosanum]